MLISIANYNKIEISFKFYPDEHAISSRPSDTPDYDEAFPYEADGGDYPDDNSAIARIVIIATAVLGTLLIIVLCAILCKNI